MVTTLKKFDRPNQPAWHASFTRRNTTSKRIENQKPPLRNKRARIYSAQLGRFISRDPLGFVDGMNLYRAHFVPGGVDPHGLLLEKFPINVPHRQPITSDPSTWPKPRPKFCYWKSVLKYSKRCGKVATFWVIVLHCEEANAPGPPKNPPVNPPTSPPILDCKDMNPDWPTCPDNMYFTAKEACRDCNSHFEGVFSPSKKPQIVDSPKFAPPPAISVHISCFDQVGDQGDSVICGSCCSDDKFSLVTRGCFCAPSNQ